MDMIFFSSRAKRVLLLMVLLAFLGSIVVPVKFLSGIILANFYTILVQALVCLVVLNYDLALNKSSELVRIRQSTSKVYGRILQFNLLAFGSFYLCQLFACYLFGARVYSQAELQITIVVLLARFLVLVLVGIMYAYSFVEGNNWIFLTVATMIPIVYHYSIEMIPLSKILEPYYKF